ncbi:MAG: NHLP family bacteriocin export ABC transporter peptidase/permease/ATPase subunit [Actinomycetota bacterium]|nr:NHLP family bacteriocin export ABC transporter peptidase/permease/ATPase subunit [Actinomycetota bacterium]
MAQARGPVRAVPMVMQMEALECGAACLAMILAYHGKWVGLDQVRHDCGVSRDGSRAINILKAARGYGLKADGYSLDAESIGDMPLPCIIHWNFKHFVVLKGFKGKWAYINDPANGAMRVSLEEFDRSFTGIALCFEKGPSFEEGGKPASVTEFARLRLKGAAGPTVVIAIAAIIGAFAGIANATFSRVFMDRILTGIDQDWLLPLVGLMAAVAVLQCIAAGINAVSALRIQASFAVSASAEFVWHLLRLPVSFYEQHNIGDLQQRQSENEGVAYTLITQLAPVMLNVVLLVVYLVVMVRYSLMLTLVGLFTVVVNLFVVNATARARVNVTRVQSRDNGRLYSSTIAGIDQIESIKASGAEDGYFAQWSGYQAALAATQARLARITQYLGALPSALVQLANVVVLTLGVWLIMEGEFTVGMLLAFQSLLSQFFSPINSLLSLNQQVQEMRTSMERIDDVLKSEPDVPDDLEEAGEAAAMPQKLAGKVDIEGLTFGYSPLGPPVISDFDLHVEPGEWAALVGDSGCGKSTIAKLVAGLYRPWEGTVSFDGVPADEVPRAQLKHSLSVVDQDIVLFDATIMDNLRLWDDSIDEADAIRGAQDACIHDTIMARPDGYGQLVTSDGANFSGGERQRLEIARALAQNPTILILDEATSALDAKTEEEVMQVIRARGITCIVVAHRLSTIRDCSQIVVLDKGRAVERGTHDELLALGGRYAALVNDGDMGGAR